MRITDHKKIETYYQALLDRRQSFVGIFFVGVKTTSVFCIATCRARKPKKENVEFFDTKGSRLIGNKKISVKGVVLNGDWWHPK